MNLEEKILENEIYLLTFYPNTQLILSQISMILDFGLSNDKIDRWFKLNKISINIINEILEEKNDRSQKTI